MSFIEIEKKSNKPRFTIDYDTRVSNLLHKLNCSIIISTYQAGKVIFISPLNEKKLIQTPISFKKPMGIALLDNKMAVATINEIQIFSKDDALTKNSPLNDQGYDALYLQRATFNCGDIDLHDLHFSKGGLWAVNTRFSCISSFDINYSFTPKWKPSFITSITPEDRCHLNGMATIDNTPVFATSLGHTNTKDGWRENITDGGLLMNVPKGEIILDKLAMPHSPRIIDKELYLLLSAKGELVKCDIENNNYEVILSTNKFIRGLAHYNGFLFIGHSQARKSSKTFNKLPIAQTSTTAGIIIFDLQNRKMIGEITYLSTVEEIFDVQILPNVTRPAILTSDHEKHKLAVSTKYNSFWKNLKKT